jgi:O-antigen/teichoic acid export membrane protein
MAAAYRLAEVLLPWFSGRADAMAGAPGVAAMLRTGWFASAASAAMLAPLVGLAPDVLGVWLGPEVASQGAPVLALMTVGGMTGAGTNTVQMFLLSRGRTAWVAALALAYGALTCLLAALLVPRFGLAAAALAGTAALIIRPPAFHCMLRELGGGPSPVAEQVSTLYLPVLVAIAVSLAAGELLPPLEGWISVAAAYAGVSAAAAVAVVAVGVVAPGGRQRRLDLKRLVAALHPERRA